MSWTNAHITTQRVRLRAATEQDKPVLAKLLQDPQVREFLGGPVSAEDLEAFKAGEVGEQWGSFVITDGAIDLCMGTVGFRDDRGEWELSYELLPRFWGRSFAFEAVGAALQWAWDEPALSEVQSVIAVTQKANVASVALLERLGFVYDRRFIEFDAMQSQYRLQRPS